MADSGLEDLLRSLTPQVLAALVRKRGDFDSAEEAVQDALLAATTQWPNDGMPASPLGWLIAVADRRLTDKWRSDHARRRRETATAVQGPRESLVAPAAEDEIDLDKDDSLILIFMCCHPSLTVPGQIALTLRAIGGLTTTQIARAFLVPEPTMAQRISRAKVRIKESGAGFQMPDESERAVRLRAVLHILYLIFNEGYTATSGPELQRTDLTREAVR